MTYGGKIIEAAIIMVLGIGVVFFFLMIMIFSVKLVASIISKLGIDKVEENRQLNVMKHTDDSAEIITAISAAVTEHQKKVQNR